MNEIVDEWREGRAGFWTEDAMYEVGDRMAARIEELERENETYRDYLTKLNTIEITVSDKTNP